MHCFWPTETQLPAGGPQLLRLHYAMRDNRLWLFLITMHNNLVCVSQSVLPYAAYI